MEFLAASSPHGAVEARRPPLLFSRRDGSAERRSDIPRAPKTSIRRPAPVALRGYVLSQVDGRTTVADLELITGLASTS